MKSVIICGSILAEDDIILVRDTLESIGHEVEIPYGVYQYLDNGKKHLPDKERADQKIDQDLISRYFHLIKKFDVVLVVNVEKNGVKNYIGGNTFLEMGFGHVLQKVIYTLNPLPEEVGYLDEIKAIKPVILNGDLTLIG